MNTQSSTMTSAASGDCGCGRGSRSLVSPAVRRSSIYPARDKSGGCGCGGAWGGAGATGLSGSWAFVRPRFFAGMLLTEDDLQAIEDYALAKRRLTNRHVFGPGVVCGLDVDCDPCKPGWITVNSGYALDCCGNDIVVGCPERLDALALLDDLRKRQGLDCGDPCEDQSERGYLLVVSYAEQPTDPVAPYVQDDCAIGDCDFSRVREGYRFELAYDVQQPDPSLWDRVRECTKVEDRRGAYAAKLMHLARLVQTRETVAAAEASGEAPGLDIPKAPEYDAATREGIGPAVELLGRSLAVLSAVSAHEAGRGPEFVLASRSRAAIRDHSRKLADRFLDSEELKELPEQEQQRARVVLEAAREQQGLEQWSVGQRIWITESGYEPAEAERVFVRDAEELRASLYKTFEETGRGNCRERRELERLSFHRLDANAGKAIYKLGDAFWSVLVGCVCDNFNPPCSQCTDTRVPLAHVQIEGCEVVDVCDLTRQWVLAPRTLNYWLPIAEELGRLLLARCCDRREYRPRAKSELDSLRDHAVQALLLARSPLEDPQFVRLREVLDQVQSASPFQPAPAPPPVAAPASAAPATTIGTPTPPTGAPSLDTLSKQVEELQEEIRKLRSGGGS
jgi:hypothetical protein